MRNRAPRRAYTLLEVMLALAIGVLLLIGLYHAMSTQVRHAQYGRDKVEEAALARAIFQKMTGEISAAVSLNDPGRFRRQQQSDGVGGLVNMLAAASSPAPTSTATPSTTGTTTTGSGTTGSGASSTTGQAIADDPVEVPLGVMGTSDQLTLFLTRAPVEALALDAGATVQHVGDARRVTYWLADGDAGAPAGLARYEVKVVTADSALDDSLPSGEDLKRCVFAPEVRSLKFRYLSPPEANAEPTWVDSWDSTELGDDGITPQGAPRAIEIQLEIVRPAVDPRQKEQVRKFRHVVAIPTANGAPLPATTTTNNSTKTGGGS